MRILIVEDDDYKYNQISQFINDKFGICAVWRKSYITGMKEIKDNEYHLLVLDMSMPTFDVQDNKNRSRPFAGRDFIQEMSRLNRIVPTIVVTQFDFFGDKEERRSLDEIDLELKEYPIIYMGVIKYNNSSLEWKDKLSKIIERSAAYDSNDVS